MATRVLSRRALRDEHDEAERGDDLETNESDGSEVDEKPARKPRARKTAEKTAKPKAPAKPRARKKAAKVPPRMFARWAVCDGGLKRLAVFEYRDLTAAETKLADLREQKKGPFCLLLIKDPYEPPAEEVAAAV
jgi:hypothetical protein